MKSAQKQAAKKEAKKAKRELIKEQTKILNAKRQLLESTRSVDNLMTLVPFLAKFSKEELKATAKSYNKAPEEYVDWAFGLVTKNMQTFYENAWGWDAEVKESEFYHEDSRFIIAFYKEHPIGFIHFRMELDEGESSLFIYDVHVEEELQRHGLGKWLVQIVEFIGLKLGYDSILVSCLKENTAGRKFFRKMNYALHRQSPAIADPENEFNYHHELLCKMLKKPAAK